jgi:DNA-binding CsgD family transcriptional regulator
MYVGSESNITCDISYVRTIGRRSLLMVANGLPGDTDLVTWGQMFRIALSHLFADVDRISIHVDRTCALLDVEPHPASVSGIHVHTGATRERELLAMTSSGERRSDRVLLALSHSGIALDDYHPPLHREYSTEADVYLGSVFLWRRAEFEPICDASRTMFEQLDGFIRFAFCSAINRFQASHISFISAVRALNQASIVANLTMRQREILLCRFNGKTAKETAEMLSISESTVRGHLRTIRKKLHGHRFPGSGSVLWREL